MLIVVLFLAIQNWQHWFLVSRYAGKSKPIRFYGQAVDQQGNPIASATVTILVEGFDSTSLLGRKSYMNEKQSTLTTGADGKFEVQSDGMVLYVKAISKPNYIDIPEDTWEVQTHAGLFCYEQTPGTPFYVPDPQRPAVFPLRKIGEPRALWPTRGGFDNPNSATTATTNASS